VQIALDCYWNDWSKQFLTAGEKLMPQTFGRILGRPARTGGMQALMIGGGNVVPGDSA
jgi:hypothetical protein